MRKKPPGYDIIPCPRIWETSGLSGCLQGGVCVSFEKALFQEVNHEIRPIRIYNRETETMGKMIATTAVALFIFAFLLVSWVRVQEKRALFFPSRDLHTLPSDVGLPCEDVWLSSGGYRLHGWFLPGPSRGVVLWLHGNAGNISDRLLQVKAMKEELGVSSLLVDYRGYGKSAGIPSEKGLYEDAAAAFRWLREDRRIDPSSIIIYGHSLGSAAAVDLALGGGKEAAGLVLESPFTSAGDMAKLIYYGLPVNILMSLRLDNVGRVGKATMPVLVIHGGDDATIPFDMGREVFEAATEPKAFLAVKGADHSDCYLVGGERYWDAWKRLIGGNPQS